MKPPADEPKKYVSSACTSILSNRFSSISAISSRWHVSLLPCPHPSLKFVPCSVWSLMYIVDASMSPVQLRLMLTGGLFFFGSTAPLLKIIHLSCDDFGWIFRQ